jgi:hypothetical protein
MDPRIQGAYRVVNDMKMLLETVASAYKSMLNLEIFEIIEGCWRIKHQDCGDVENNASQVTEQVNDYNCWAVPSTADTDGTDTDSAKTITQMSNAEHIFPLFHGIPRSNNWIVHLDVMMDTNATTTAMPDDLDTKDIEQYAAFSRENGLAPAAQLVGKKECQRR